MSVSPAVLENLEYAANASIMEIELLERAMLSAKLEEKSGLATRLAKEADNLSALLTRLQKVLPEDGRKEPVQPEEGEVEEVNMTMATLALMYLEKRMHQPVCERCGKLKAPEAYGSVWDRRAEPDVHEMYLRSRSAAKVKAEQDYQPISEQAAAAQRTIED